MTTPSTARKAGPFNGNGSTTSFPFTFKVFAAADIAVTIANSLGVETALVLDTDYSVSLNANQETSPGGTITYPISGSPLAVGSVLAIVGDLDYDQPLDLPSGGNFSPLALENQLDRTVMQIQQLRETISRSLLVPITSDAAPTLPFPEANQLIGWDAGGVSLQNVPVSDLATAVGYGTFRYDTFTGNGSTTEFALTADPAAVGNLDVAIDGLTQVPGTDYTLISGEIVFTAAPSNGAEILARYGQALPITGPVDASAVTYQPAGTGAVATTVQTKLRETVSVKDFGAVGDGVTDDTAAIQAALNDAAGAVGAARAEVYLPEGRYNVTGVTLPSRVILSGPGELYPVGSGVTALTLTDTLYSSVKDISIYLNASNQKAISIVSSASYSQLNEFFGVKIDGTLPAGSVGIEINNSFSNSFFGCNVLRAATGVTFTNAANANHFYGGEIRSVNSNANCANPVVHGSACWSNGFHGTVIENWALPIQMNGGVLTIDSGCYIEAFASAASIAMAGGDLRVIGNYLNNGFIFISAGNSISIRDNTFDGLLSSSTYPFIKFTADVATRLNCGGNQVLDTTTPGVLLQPRQYWTGAAFAYRSIANRVEFIESKPVRFQSRLASDANDITGDGTAYTVLWGGNEQFDDGSNVGATFTAPENGLYWLGVTIYLNSLLVASHDNITVTIQTSNRLYQVFTAGADMPTTAGRQSVNGSALVDMEASDTAYVIVTVSGSSKTVDILRGDAVNGYTTFSGFKVA